MARKVVEDVLVQVRLPPTFVAISIVSSILLILLVIFCLTSFFIPAEDPPENVVYVVATVFGGK